LARRDCGCNWSKKPFAGGWRGSNGTFGERLCCTWTPGRGLEPAFCPRARSSPSLSLPRCRPPGRPAAVAADLPLPLPPPPLPPYCPCGCGPPAAAFAERIAVGSKRLPDHEYENEKSDCTAHLFHKFWTCNFIENTSHPRYNTINIQSMTLRFENFEIILSRLL
jgi:hypothetical protein